jgi:hypothetical protein
MLYSKPIIIGPQSQYGNDRWEVYSHKLKRNVTLYSDLEYDHWVLIESNPEVVFFCEQPLKIRIRLPIGVVTTIFDLWIQWRSGLEEFQEIKFEKDLEDAHSNSRVTRQIQAQKKWCEINSKKYSVITEKSIRSNLTYLSNLKFILRHLGSDYNECKRAYSERIILMLSEQGPSSFSEIENVFREVEFPIIRNAVFDLIYSGKLTTSLNEKPLNMNSIIEVTNV